MDWRWFYRHSRNEIRNFVTEAWSTIQNSARMPLKSRAGAKTDARSIYSNTFQIWLQQKIHIIQICFIILYIIPIHVKSFQYTHLSPQLKPSTSSQRPTATWRGKPQDESHEDMETAAEYRHWYFWKRSEPQNDPKKDEANKFKQAIFGHFWS